MIHRIIVDGYKTLSNFQLDFKEGLNILVGPNGSGKTNIISFLEFLGFLIKSQVSNAISNAGGAGTVFRKVSKNSYSKDISATIIGTVKLGYRKYVYYSYAFTISIGDLIEPISYSHQRFRILIRTVNGIERIDAKRKFDFDIEMRPGNEDNPKVTIHSLEPKVMQDRLWAYSDDPSNQLTQEEFRKQMVHLCERRMLRDRSILDAVFFVGRSYIRKIVDDLSGGRIFNIEPTRVKIPDDSAKSPGIEKDGSGLYSTLYALIQKERKPTKNRWIGVPTISDTTLGRTSFKTILEFIQRANKWISNLEVTNNAFDNQLQIKVTMEGEGDKVPVLPLSAMSDGTVKWISLITAIMTNRRMYSIEEPENYLHPLMLAEIINIMRTNIPENQFVLISTHSETLINNATPEEIIVVNNEKGRTSVKRLKNAEDLNEEIRRTGFGLGYYYMSGSFELV